jgi:hypothetical protein
MKGFVVPLAALALALAPTSLAAQDCSVDASAGQFDISFDGANFDGTDTTFTYCVTTNDDPALSNWLLSLDPQCVSSNDLTGCGPEPCDYQVDDPNLDLTGIKWDDLEVDPGETQCYDFSLAGDWTGQIGPVQIGLKAGQGTHYADICGPICFFCTASLDITSGTSALPAYSLRVEHRRPPTVETAVAFKLFNERGRKIKRWKSEDLTLAYGDVYEISGYIPVDRALRPGTYRLQITMKGMSGWIIRETTFVVE